MHQMKNSSTMRDQRGQTTPQIDQMRNPAGSSFKSKGFGSNSRVPLTNQMKMVTKEGFGKNLINEPQTEACEKNGHLKENPQKNEVESPEAKELSREELAGTLLANKMQNMHGEPSQIDRKSRFVSLLKDSAQSRSKELDCQTLDKGIEHNSRLIGSVDPYYWLNKQPAMTPDSRRVLANYAVALSFRGFRATLDYPLFESMHLLDVVLTHLDHPVHHSQLQILYMTCLFLTIQEMRLEYPTLGEYLDEMIVLMEETFPGHMFQESIGHLKLLLKKKFPDKTVCDLASHNPARHFKVLVSSGLLTSTHIQEKQLYDVGMMLLETLLFDLGALRLDPHLVAISVVLVLKKTQTQENEGSWLEKYLNSLATNVPVSEVSRCTKYLIRSVTETRQPTIVLEKYDCSSRSFASHLQIIRIDSNAEVEEQDGQKRRSNSLSLPKLR